MILQCNLIYCMICFLNICSDGGRYYLPVKVVSDAHRNLRGIQAEGNLKKLFIGNTIRTNI